MLNESLKLVAQESQSYTVRNDPNLYYERYDNAWRQKNFQMMLTLVRARQEVLDFFQREERRVFPWMNKATTMTDIALNALSFWLVEDQTQNRSFKRILVLREYFRKLQDLVLKVEEMQLFPTLLQNLISDDNETIEAGILFLLLLSPNTIITGVLAGIESGDCSLLKDYIEILSVLMSDEDRSHHVRLMAIATLCNLLSVQNFEALSDKQEEQGSEPMLDQDGVFELSREISRSLLEESKASTCSKSEEGLSLEQVKLTNLSHFINKEHLVSELIEIMNKVNHCYTVWKKRKETRKLTKSERKQYMGNYIDEWEVSQLIKAILRFFGAQEAKELLSLTTFQQFFGTQETNLKSLFFTIKRDLDFQNKILTDLQELRLEKQASSKSKEQQAEDVRDETKSLETMLLSPRGSQSVEEVKEIYELGDCQILFEQVTKIRKRIDSQKQKIKEKKRDTLLYERHGSVNILRVSSRKSKKRSKLGSSNSSCYHCQIF